MSIPEFFFCISIGSLGKDNSTAVVTVVVLDTAIITGTTNGLRIKTWQVLKIKFRSYGQISSSGVVTWAVVHK
jgi:Glycosyl hydrolases family 28